MMRTRLAATVLCLAAVACGGDDAGRPSPSAAPSTTSPSATPMAKEAYVGAVNQVCKEVLTQADAIQEPQTAAQYVSATEKYIGILEDGQADLKTLTPPAADKAKADEFVAANEEQIQVLRDLLPKIQAHADKNDKDAVEAEFAAAFERFNEIAQEQATWATEYGLSECI